MRIRVRENTSEPHLPGASDILRTAGHPPRNSPRLLATVGDTQPFRRNITFEK